MTEPLQRDRTSSEREDELQILGSRHTFLQEQLHSALKVQEEKISLDLCLTAAGKVSEPLPLIEYTAGRSAEYTVDPTQYIVILVMLCVCSVWLVTLSTTKSALTTPSNEVDTSASFSKTYSMLQHEEDRLNRSRRRRVSSSTPNTRSKTAKTQTEGK